jgi:hypothetical protein
VVPSIFASQKLLARINVAAVAFALAACTAVLFTAARFTNGWVVGLPTVLVGTAWAALLRRPRTVGSTSIRLGWLLSIPLAASNAGLACVGLFASEPNASTLWAIIGGMFVGATFGIFIWGPALLMTLLCFGVPIAWAQRQATRGLAGTERGERIVGLVCTVLSLAAFVTALVTGRPDESLHAHFTHAGLESGWFFALALSLVGTVLGTSAFVLSTLRERRRSVFIARVEAGEEARFRVDATSEGKVLLRVERHGAGAYRVADLEEEICLLDDEGRATEVRALQSR